MKRKGLGFIQIYWGNGKGKTTSALGTALRACGNGYKVHFVQFMKDGASSLEQQLPGEITALERFDDFSWKRFGTGNWVIGKPTQEQVSKVKEAVEHVKEGFYQGFDIVVADEILYAVQLGIIGEEEVLSLMDEKPEEIELILTGSHEPFQRIFDKADLVTEVRKIKHPYDSGYIARRGLEY